MNQPDIQGASVVVETYIPEMPRLVLPAPWGVGVMLGLVPRLRVSDSPGLGAVAVAQVANRDSEIYASGLTWLGVCARLAGGLGLAALAPWDAFLPGSMGTVEVVECHAVASAGWRGFDLVLADPRPAWRAAA